MYILSCIYLVEMKIFTNKNYPVYIRYNYRHYVKCNNKCMKYMTSQLQACMHISWMKSALILLLHNNYRLSFSLAILNSIIKNNTVAVKTHTTIIIV